MRRQTAHFWGGVFDVFQEEGDNREAVLSLSGKRRCERKKAKSKGRVQALSRKARAAQALGQRRWQLQDGRQPRGGDRARHDLAGPDRCDGSTLFKVQKGESWSATSSRRARSCSRQARATSQRWRLPASRVAPSSRSCSWRRWRSRRVGPARARSCRSTPPRIARRGSPSAPAPRSQLHPARRPQLPPPEPAWVLCRILDERETSTQGRYVCSRLIRVALEVRRAAGPR